MDDSTITTQEVIGGKGENVISFELRWLVGRREVSLVLKR